MLGPGTKSRCGRWMNRVPRGATERFVRTVESYRQRNWDKWAQTWEFQARLKARACAGDEAVGRARGKLRSPDVWSAADARRIRRGCARDAPSSKTTFSDRTRPESRLGRGGSRDVEFTVQLLQLNSRSHRRLLRVRPTLDVIEAREIAQRRASACLVPPVPALEHRTRCLE